MFPLTAHTYKRSFLRPALTAVLLMLVGGAFAQTPDYIMQAGDGAFVMEVYRADGSIKLLVQLNNPADYSYITIERSLDNQNSFSQCKYFVPKEEKTVHGAITKDDVYTLSSSKDVYYRIKTVTADGVSRTYPPVRLPAPGENEDAVARLPK